MACHTDKCETTHMAGESSDDTSKIMNSELPVATEERNLDVSIDYSVKISSDHVKSKMSVNKDKTSASTKPQKSLLGVQCVALVTVLQEKEQLKKRAKMMKR